MQCTSIGIELSVLLTALLIALLFLVIKNIITKYLEVLACMELKPKQLLSSIKYKPFIFLLLNFSISTIILTACLSNAAIYFNIYSGSLITVSSFLLGVLPTNSKFLHSHLQFL
jgi:hypothetical protein